MLNNKLKNRKQLPPFGVLNNFKIDYTRLYEHCVQNNLLDYDIYTDMMLSKTKKFSRLLTTNQHCVNSFVVEDGANSLEGEKYRQLYLTEFDFSKASNSENSSDDTIFSRTKRLNPASPIYSPEADELNYGIRNHLVTGIFREILDFFQSKVTRVRLAYLSPNYSVRPHVDYDPSYITRYHIPIITNEKCNMYVSEKINGVEHVVSSYFPADGRIYFLNSGKRHWATNDSNNPRLHLIIDVHGQEELKHLVPYL
jgi:hypothetical protein